MDSAWGRLHQTVLRTSGARTYHCLTAAMGIASGFADVDWLGRVIGLGACMRMVPVAQVYVPLANTSVVRRAEPGTRAPKQQLKHACPLGKHACSMHAEVCMRGESLVRPVLAPLSSLEQSCCSTRANECMA